MSVKLLHKDAKAPTIATAGSAGIDLRALEDTIIIGNSSEVIRTGVNIKIPEGFFGLLTHRSSLAFNLSCISSLGIIDSDFEGEIRVKMFCLGEEGAIIQKGTRIAQLVILPYCHGASIGIPVGGAIRSSGGFGSTGER